MLTIVSVRYNIAEPVGGNRHDLGMEKHHADIG